MAYFVKEYDDNDEFIGDKLYYSKRDAIDSVKFVRDTKIYADLIYIYFDGYGDLHQETIMTSRHREIE